MSARSIEIICGYHAVRHVVSRRAHDVLEVYIAQTKKRFTRLDALRRSCEDASIPIQYISPAKLDRLAGVKNHQGIAARCRTGSTEKTATIADLCAGQLGDTSIILVLDRVMDPHNLGACIRTADATGVDAVILPRKHSAPLSATARKVASGAAENTDVIKVTNIARSLRQLREAGCQIIGTTSDADKSIYEIDVMFPVALVMGAEEGGMRQNTRKQCDQLVKIPMYGFVESLNMSVAAGVCLYEIRRQKTDDR